VGLAISGCKDHAIHDIFHSKKTSHPNVTNNQEEAKEEEAK
jgi:hypothetical protein